ncbi:tigger transposable element-derived protein 6-like [Rhizophagus irregularis DAOM 181602=DAOM 197198]|nr:tigger transposable element-derived protein 6-like [Rhizophagus irregularis DAOM 181602=DAOM 197198]
MKEYVKWGEAASAPLETLNEERQKLREIIKDYDLNDVFNCDETGLYWDLEPSKTLARGPLSGKKKSKKRVTILLTCNATGTEKLTPFFIHTSKNPRALKGKKKMIYLLIIIGIKQRGCRSLFGTIYLKKLDTKMRLQNRKILLLVDNAPVHITNENTQLTNVTLHFLPPNTTSHLQPCDAGIINSFKAKYRKLLVKNRVEAYEISQQLNKGADSLNIHDAIVFCTNAWNAVTQETIYNCWKHTGILPLVNQEEVDESVNQLGEDNQVEREEIQFLIDQLPFDDHMDADEFIHIDDHLKSNEGLTDEEIISLVNLDKNELEVESDEEIPSVISKVQTLNDLDDLVMFFKYSSLNNSINQSELNTLQKLRHEVLRSHITDLKQATLDSYFTSNPNNSAEFGGSVRPDIATKELFPETIKMKLRLKSLSTANCDDLENYLRACATWILDKTTISVRSKACENFTIRNQRRATGKNIRFIPKCYLEHPLSKLLLNINLKSLWVSADEDNDNTAIWTKLAQFGKDGFLKEKKHFKNYLLSESSREYEIFRQIFAGMSVRSIRYLRAVDVVTNPELIYENILKFSQLIKALNWNGLVVGMTDS